MNSFLKSAAKYFLWVLIPLLILAACLTYLMYSSAGDQTGYTYELF